jgi:hypothetical protein
MANLCTFLLDINRRRYINATPKNENIAAQYKIYLHVVFDMGQNCQPYFSFFCKTLRFYEKMHWKKGKLHLPYRNTGKILCGEHFVTSTLKEAVRPM